MQPVQDLTVEDRVSRTQFQYSLEAWTQSRTGRPTRELVDKLQAPYRAATDVASDQQDQALQARTGHRPRHRFAAGDRHGHVDNTLYDAFGQRQVSTIFTQLNQYHVVLEVATGELPDRTPTR
jgi:multidrug efflux pump